MPLAVSIDETTREQITGGGVFPQKLDSEFPMEGDDPLRLSGRPKMMTRKMELPREKKSSLVEGGPRKERPKTAVRKLAALRTPLSRSSNRPRSAAVTPIPGQLTNNQRPLSARVPLKPVVGRGRVLRSHGSIDSGLSPHHSSPDDQSSEDEEESEESRGHDTTEEDEDESVDSGIIKVSISRYDAAEEQEAEASVSHPKEREELANNRDETSNKNGVNNGEGEANYIDEPKTNKVIFVKEAETENENENESEIETAEDELLDDEMDAANGEVVFTGHQKVVPQAEEKEEDNGREIAKNAKAEIETEVNRDLVLTDVEPHELCGILARQEKRDNLTSAGHYDVQHGGQEKEDLKISEEERPSYEKRMEDVINRLELEEKKTYDMAVYKTAKELENTDNLEIKDSFKLSPNKTSNEKEDVKEKEPVETKDTDKATYNVLSYQSKSSSMKEVVTKNDETQDHTTLADEELAELKRKCLARVEKHKSTPIVSNPPVIKDFSNSQKLLNFLDKTEEKDRATINNVKRSNYTAQVNICHS